MEIEDFDSHGEYGTEPNTDVTRQQIQFSITRYLAQREHGFNEIIRKLTQKGYPQDLCADVLDKFREADLQSDYRFAEQLVQRRLSKGYGENYILAEGQNKGVDSDVLMRVMEAMDIDWREQTRMAAEAKFGASSPKDFKEKMKRCQFLQNRGFDYSDITSIYP